MIDCRRIWPDLTEKVRAAVAFTIPIPIAITPGAYAEGAELLEEARSHVNAGNIDAAIVSARGAMERAGAAAHWPALGGDNARSRSVEQPWRASYQAAFRQASGAGHEDDVTSPRTSPTPNLSFTSTNHQPHKIYPN